MNKCACGCGGIVTPGCNYVKNHNGMRGKTWADSMGKERAEKRKIELGNKRRGKSTSLLGKSWEEQMPNKERLLKRKIKARIRFLHKSFEEVYGEKRAKEIKWKSHLTKTLPINKDKLLSLKLKAHQTIKISQESK